MLLVLDTVTRALAHGSGVLFLLVSFYVAGDAVARTFFHASTAVSAEFGGYVPAVGTMWALANTLRVGAHVRIDILLPYLPRLFRSVLDYVAVAVMALFASAIALSAWRLTIESLTTDARAMSFLRTPLFLPQGLMALGFTALFVEAVVILMVGCVESARLGQLAPLEGVEAPTLLEQAAPPGAS